MDAIFGLVGFLVAVVIFDLAALRFGRDSRPLDPEPPLGATTTPTRTPRGRLTRRPRHAVARLGGEMRRPRLLRPSFAPYVARDVFAYREFDLAAAGK